MLNPKGTKRAGASYEQLFAYECMQRGMDPHIPLGDFLPHDILVVNQAGNYFKVQVKGTGNACKHKKTKNTADRYSITAIRDVESHSTDSLDCAKVDVWAVYIQPVNQWYLIPCIDMDECIKGGRTLRFYPHTENGSRAITEKYRNNWEVFKRWTQ
tara:strand:+ start:213 stop:680 length:468 start_codon:yes stop_codon:yes gene_type:complete